MTDFSRMISDALPNYMRDLETLVNMDCGTHNKAGVDAVSRIVEERLREFGATVTRFPQEKYGDCLYGAWRGKGTARVFLIGHMDTVYSDGTTSQFPMHRLGTKLKGPGVSDMKSGLLSAMYAAHAIVQSGFDNFAEIGIFCNSEEEVGSPVSRDVYAQFARGANAALVLEGGRANGNIVSARKGVGTFAVTVHGRSSHAGVEPEKGANAIIALARYADALQSLNGMRDGLTVNVGVVRGGTKTNVVPDFAQAEIDVRILRVEDGVALEKAVHEIVSREMVPGTTAELSGGIKNPPMERTPQIAHLAELAKQATRELGFEIQDQSTGGGSDGNYTASLGTPTLDGLGPVGGDDHNATSEWLDYNSIVPRTAMVAKLIVAICEGK